MAVLSGLHVVCSRAGGTGAKNSNAPNIMNGIDWSETLASGGTTVNVTKSADGNGQSVLHLLSSDNGWVSIGPDPDSTTDPRFFIIAYTPLDLFVAPGHKVAYTVDA